MFEEVIETPTLGAKLGTTTQLSPLLRKARKLGLEAGEIEELAIERGCDYYGGTNPRTNPSPAPKIPLHVFTNAELAIALLNPALRYKPQSLRLGAAMLSAEGNSPEEIAWLAKLERCECIVRYVAEAGAKFEPQNSFWPSLLGLLPKTNSPKSSVVPHPTRFVAMTSLTRHGVEKVVEWIRPAPDKAHG